MVLPLEESSLSIPGEGHAFFRLLLGPDTCAYLLLFPGLESPDRGILVPCNDHPTDLCVRSTEQFLLSLLVPMQLTDLDQGTTVAASDFRKIKQKAELEFSFFLMSNP